MPPRRERADPALSSCWRHHRTNIFHASLLIREIPEHSAFQTSGCGCRNNAKRQGGLTRAAGLSLARPTRPRLVRLDRKTRDADLRIRCRVALKVAEGMSCTEAARALGCAPSTAARIVARFRRHGEAGLIDGRSENGN